MCHINNAINQKGGERMVEDMTLDELKQVTIDYYVNLQRIKKLIPAITRNWNTN